MKLFPPLGEGRIHRVTQTYHGETAARPNDLTKQVAVDYSAVTGAAVYAVADGTVAKQGSDYFFLDIGLPYYIVYVHVTGWPAIGTKVKRGQVVAKIGSAPPTHLHLGLKMKDGTPPPHGFMELVDRSVVFGVGFPKGSPQYNEILATWFLSDTKLDWSKFADIDPFDTPQLGSRYEFLRDTNVRSAPRVSAPINGLARQGAVGEVSVPGVWFADGYEWLFTNLHSIEGYSIKKNVVRTSKEKTTPDAGPIPTPTDPCKERVAKLQSQIDEKTAEYEALANQARLLEERNVTLEEQAKMDNSVINDLVKAIGDSKRKFEELTVKSEELAREVEGLIKAEGSRHPLVRFLERILPVRM